MISEVTFIRRTSAVFLAAVFFTTVQGQAFGLQTCPAHDGVPEPDPPAPLSSGSHDHPSDHASSHGPLKGPSTHEQDHSTDHDICMGECHVSIGKHLADFSGHFAQSKVPLFSSTAGLISSRTAWVGPRHRPFELHLPNAPPRSA